MIAAATQGSEEGTELCGWKEQQKYPHS